MQAGLVKRSQAEVAAAAAEKRRAKEARKTAKAQQTRRVEDGAAKLARLQAKQRAADATRDANLNRPIAPSRLSVKAPSTRVAGQANTSTSRRKSSGLGDGDDPTESPPISPSPSPVDGGDEDTIGPVPTALVSVRSNNMASSSHVKALWSDGIGNTLEKPSRLSLSLAFMFSLSLVSAVFPYYVSDQVFIGSPSRLRRLVWLTTISLNCPTFMMKYRWTSTSTSMPPRKYSTTNTPLTRPTRPTLHTLVVYIQALHIYYHMLTQW